MKTNFKSLILFVFLFLIPIIGFTQSQDSVKVMIIEKDTTIVITTNQLRTINCIIVDWELLKKNIGIYKEIIHQDSMILLAKDSVIYHHREIEAKQKIYYTEAVRNLETALAKEKRSKKWATGLLGGGLLIILGVLIGT